jgi:vacuolar-type H+-ATPase subunit H
MSGTPKNPQVGDLSIDATDLASFIVDLPPGAMQGMRTEHEGVDDVVAEITANQATWGDKAGVTAGDFDQVTTSTQRIQLIDTYLGPARKMVEMLEETRAQEVDARERAISSIAKSAETRASKPANKVLLAKYEATRAYRSEFANKGAKTRKKNVEAAKSAGATTTPADKTATTPAAEDKSATPATTGGKTGTSSGSGNG